jgi:hypothetical protein
MKEAFTLIKFEKKWRINALCKQISSLTEMKLLKLSHQTKTLLNSLTIKLKSL